MSYNYGQVEACAEEIRRITDFIPEYACILSGSLIEITNEMNIVCTLKASELNNYPNAKEAASESQFVFGSYNGKKLIIMTGRVRTRDGIGNEAILFPIRLFRKLGADKLVITNACGGINPFFDTDAFAVIKDHISFFVSRPFDGSVFDEKEIVTQDMTHIYSSEMNKKVIECGKKNNIAVREALFAATLGPQYQTPAEIQALKIMGCDVIASSGVIEATCARYIGMEMCLLSNVSNIAAGLDENPVELASIKQTVIAKKDNHLKLLKSIFE